MRGTLQESFEAWIDKETSKKGCWLWTGSKTRKDDKGYGRIQVNGKRQLAHRVSWELHNPTQPIPEGMCVLHECDTPPCVNPAHLKIGTQKDNMQDMVKRRRSAKGDRHGFHTHPERVPRGDKHYLRQHPELSPRGEKNGCCKLTEDNVRAIFHTKGTHKQIAEEYGVHNSQVSRIRNGKRWRHLTMEIK